jgi:hypothetical protein
VLSTWLTSKSFNGKSVLNGSPTGGSLWT